MGSVARAGQADVRAGSPVVSNTYRGDGKHFRSWRLMIGAICSREATPVANTDRLARRLNLTDPQKAALKDLTDGSASADASAKKSLCADKPDLSTAPGRMAF